MKFTCKICKDKTVNINCCKYIDGVLYKFCNRCGTVNEKKGWYIQTDFLLKKNKSITGLNTRQKICIKCRNKKLKTERNLRINLGKKPRKIKDETFKCYTYRYCKYIQQKEIYLHKLFDDDYDKNEIKYYLNK